MLEKQSNARNLQLNKSTIKVWVESWFGTVYTQLIDQMLSCLS